MECIIKYKFSLVFDYVLMIVPLAICVLISIYTYFKCLFFFRNFPDRFTQPVFEEIKYYPVVFLLCNSTSVLLDTLLFCEINVPEYLFLIDQFFKGIQGLLIAFVFFYKKLNFSWNFFSKIFSDGLHISSPCKNTLSQIEKVK